MKINPLGIYFAFIAFVIIFFTGRYCGKETCPKSVSKDSTTIVTVRDSFVVHDTVRLVINNPAKFKYIYLKEKPDSVSCDTFTREYSDIIPDTNFIFFNYKSLVSGVQREIKFDYQLKPGKIQIVKEKTTVKEKFEVQVDIGGKLWKFYAGGKTIIQPDRLGGAPSLLITKDKLGIEANYDLKYKNINIGIYYLIFKF